MSSIYYYDDLNRPVSFGQSLELPCTCYFKAMEMGYTDVYSMWRNINFLWDDNGNCISGFFMPRETPLPFKFVEGDNNYDTKVNIGEYDSLYDGCEPLISKDGCKLRYCHNYIKNQYIKQFGLPRLKMIDSKSKEPYILIHYRNSLKEKQQPRNIESVWYERLIQYIRDNSDIKIYKIGEQSPFDKSCDKVYPYAQRNLGNFVRLLKDCNLYIGSPCGPWVLSIYLGSPILSMVKDDTIYEGEKDVFNDFLDDKQILIKTKEENFDSMKNHIDRFI